MTRRLVGQAYNKSIGKSWADGRSIGGFFIAQLWFGQDKRRWTFCSQLQQNIFNHQRLWADGILFPSLRQYSVEVFSMSGKKLIIAAVATEFEQDKTDNTYLFYRLTFLTSNQVGIFKVSSLSQEKSFAKLVGNSGIMVADSTSDNKVKEFIAMKGASPRIAVDYTMVARSRSWPIELKEDKTIEQDSKIIGNFQPMGSRNEMDLYEFHIPSGVIIAKISFTGGNNAQNFELFTAKDNLKRVVPIPTTDKILAATFNIDKNQFALKRIVKWLVDNQYL